MRNTAEKLKDLVWEFDGLMIRPAESQEELFAEGEALNHCVGRGGYAKKMGNGESAIFFIRKKPDEPYVTLELSLKTFEKIQCYGKGDTWPGKKIDNFVRKWIKEIVKQNMENKGRKTA